MWDEWFELENEIPILRKEVRSIEYLKKIYTRDNGQVTTVNEKTVRIKKQAPKEIAYIALILNKKLFTGYGSEAKRTAKIKERLGLEPNWKPDEEILNAIRLLSEDTAIIQQRLIDTLRSNLESNLEMFQEVELNTKKVLKFLQEDIGELTTEQLTERKVIIDSAKADFKLVLGFINDLATSFEKLDALETKLKQADRRQGKEVSRLETDGNLYTRKQRSIL